MTKYFKCFLNLEFSILTLFKLETISLNWDIMSNSNLPKLQFKTLKFSADHAGPIIHAFSFRYAAYTVYEKCVETNCH